MGRGSGDGVNGWLPAANVESVLRCGYPRLRRARPEESAATGCRRDCGEQRGAAARDLGGVRRGERQIASSLPNTPVLTAECLQGRILCPWSTFSVVPLLTAPPAILGHCLKAEEFQPPATSTYCRRCCLVPIPYHGLEDAAG